MQTERRDAVAIVTIDRPHRRNALDLNTIELLTSALTDVVDGDDEAVRAVVLTGAPPAFCAGADLGGVDGDVFASALAGLFHSITVLPVPVVAAIDGPALGAGTQLAVACDLRVASPSSRFGIPAARLGLMVDQWTVRRLHAQFTPAVARAMLLAAEPYDGERLHAIGAVHRLGDRDDAIAWAAELAALAPLTIAGHKLAAERLDVGAAPAPDVDAFRARVWASADAVEGRAAFVEKRHPDFTGR